MSTKAHFGDISYNVFNRRKSSYFIIKPLDFTISCRMDHFTESNHQKLIFLFTFSLFTKICLSGFGVTEYTV